MAVRSHRRAPPFLAAMFLGFLVGAATCGRTTSSSSTLAHSQPRTNLAEDKSRLGSTPPSCHNRCEACNPCSPVQVATIPKFSRSTRAGAGDGDGVAAYGQYSNYKPVEWKCGCAGRLYNP